MLGGCGVSNSPRPQRTVVVIPACNEGRTVEAVVRSIREGQGLPVIVVDDASTDDTAARARSGGATVLSLINRLGAWGATQAGFRYAMQQRFDAVVTCDADGQHDPAQINVLLDALARGDHDVVIGSCPERGSALRHIAWAMFRCLTQMRITDLTSGFRAYNGSSYRLLASPKATLLDYQDVGVLLLLRHGKLRIGEVDVPIGERADGKSRIFNSWYAVGRYMFMTMLTIVLKPGCRIR